MGILYEDDEAYQIYRRLGLWMASIEGEIQKEGADRVKLSQKYKILREKKMKYYLIWESRV